MTLNLISNIIKSVLIMIIYLKIFIILLKLGNHSNFKIRTD